jgi:hypothetical protein
MSRTSPYAHARRLFLLATILIFSANAAEAAPQTFVSTKGDDANMCEHASPCRTFAGALIRSHIGGEIVVLDSGEYGPVTIPFSLNITAVGVYAGITVTDGNAVTVKTGTGSVVALRGLTLKGWNIGSGIAYEGPGAAREGDENEPTAALHVEGCTISGFAVAGIHFEGNGSLFVKDTTVRNNAGAGIELTAPQGEKVRASVVNSRLEKNSTGLTAHGPGNVEVIARDTVAAGNKSTGFSVWTNAARMQLQGCVSTNQHTGVSATDWGRVTLEGCELTSLNTGLYVAADGIARLSGTTITDNSFGVVNTKIFGVGNYGHVYTFGNNRVFGNTQETAGKASLVAQQF